MKKIAILVLFISLTVLLSTVPVKAGVLTNLIAGSGGYLASGNFVAVGFNAYAGETIRINSINLSDSSTTGICGLSSYSSLEQPFIFAFSWETVIVDFFVSDLYVWLCEYYSGSPGGVILAVYNDFLLSQDNAQIKSHQDSDYPLEAINSLKEKFKQYEEKLKQ
jgi:hypothetical protein